MSVPVAKRKIRAPRSALRQKRRFRRRTIRTLVEYTTETGIQCEPATTLGPGGLFIQTDTPVPKGSILKLRFRISDDLPVREIEGRVAWSKSIADGNPRTPGFGIEFLHRTGINTVAEDLKTLD